MVGVLLLSMEMSLTRSGSGTTRRNRPNTSRPTEHNMKIQFSKKMKAAKGQKRMTPSSGLQRLRQLQTCRIKLIRSLR
jgi:hypothetical protein